MAADYRSTRLTTGSTAYEYDVVGNRTVMTATTPLSGTVVTTYTYDAANRLTARAVSDGRTYTYDWSARGQMLVEWTQGYPVRTFTYDGRPTVSTPWGTVSAPVMAFCPARSASYMICSGRLCATRGK